MSLLFDTLRCWSIDSKVAWWAVQLLRSASAFGCSRGNDALGVAAAETTNGSMFPPLALCPIEENEGAMWTLSSSVEVLTELLCSWDVALPLISGLLFVCVPRTQVSASFFCHQCLSPT